MEKIKEIGLTEMESIIGGVGGTSGIAPEKGGNNESITKLDDNIGVVVGTNNTLDEAIRNINATEKKTEQTAAGIGIRG